MIDAPSLITPIASALASPLDPTLVVALTCLVVTALVTLTLLRAWQDWIDLKRRELDNASAGFAARQDSYEEMPQLSTGAARIELADMKERIKKLEAIANGVEL